MIKSDPNLIRLLHLICSEFSNKIIMGDVNADVVSDSNSDTKYISYLMYELSLKLSTLVKLITLPLETPG